MADAPPPPGTVIDVPGVPNLRDVGGWPIRDGGRVRRGQLYRSIQLNRLRGAGLAAFEALDIRTVYDLRTEPERSAEPDLLPERIEHVVADVLADAEGAAPAQLPALLSDPELAHEELGDGKAEALFQRWYRAIVSLPSARTAYRTLFTGLADPGRRPALIHCTTGKDRTGWGAAALLMLLAVSDDDVMTDYLLTNDELVPALRPVFDRFAQAGGDPALVEPVLGVREAYLCTALAEMTTRFGDIENYFGSGLGIDADTRETLRTACTDVTDG